MQIKDLTPNPKNPRTITPEKLKALKNALYEFGDLGGFVFNKTTGQLVGGHQRARALPQTASVTIEKKYLKPTRTGTIAEGFVVVDGERFKYREVKWREDRERLANIAANKGAGEWDMPQLGDWFKELNETKLDLDLSMFDEKEREEFLGADTKSKATGVDEDETPEPPKVAKTKLGQIYILGKHRLMCGDSTNEVHLKRLLKDEKPDMIFTDPPYGMNLDTNYDKMYAFGDHTHTGNRFKKVEGDNKDYDPSPILKIKAKRIFIWGADYFYTKLPKNGCFIAWDKRSETLDRVPGNTTEFCWAYPSTRRTSVRIIWSGHYGMNGDDAGKRMHPTQKPIKLAEWFLDQWGKGIKSIIDLYGGSGSTLIACEKTKRKCFMMELDPHYCDVIVARWEKYTGEKARLVAVQKKQAKSKEQHGHTSF